MQSPACQRWWKLAKVLRGSDESSVLSMDGNLARVLFITTSSNAVDADDHNTEFEWINLIPLDPDGTAADCEPLQLRTYRGFRSMKLNKKLEHLSGFDNTGNVNLWFSELLLAHAFYFPHLYPGIENAWNAKTIRVRRICELGSGMTGAAGLSAAFSKAVKPETVVLTDGNDACVESLKAIVARNTRKFGRSDCKIELMALKLQWSDETSESSAQVPDNELVHSFQLVIASDCLFHTSSHPGLLSLADSLLSSESGSTFLLLAPKRGSSFDAFVDLVSQHPNWLPTVLRPKEFISQVILNKLLAVLEEWKEENIYNSLIGHVILLRRRLPANPSCT